MTMDEPRRKAAQGVTSEMSIPDTKGNQMVGIHNGNGFF